MVVAQICSAFTAVLVDFWMAHRNKPVEKPKSREEILADAVMLSQQVIAEKDEKIAQVTYERDKANSLNNSSGSIPWKPGGYRPGGNLMRLLFTNLYCWVYCRLIFHNILFMEEVMISNRKLTHHSKFINNIFIVLLGGVILLTSGCAARMNTTVNPDFTNKITQVSALAITGAGGTDAVPSFINKGYKVIDVGQSNNPIEYAKSKSIPYLVTVDAIGTSHAWWDGIFDYSMRVTDTSDGNIVWSATANYGNGLAVNQMAATKKAMHDMVDKFSMIFPPKN